jgi:hypothetical protein
MSEREQKLKAAEREVRQLRALIRTLGDETKRSAFQIEVDPTESGGAMLTIRSTAGPEMEKLQARILAGVFTALQWKTGEVTDAEVAPGEEEGAQG